MTNNTANSEFMRSDHALSVLESLRRGLPLNSLSLAELSVDERTYIETEDCVRSALYSQLDSRIHAGTSEWVKKLVYCYRDLFTNPRRALDALAEIEENCPDHLNFPLRLKFWRAHLNLLLGDIEIGKRELVQIASIIPEGIWKSEMLAIRAMGFYYVGKMREALAAHHDCQNSIKLSPDIFLQTFDCGMATRTALKLCDPANFEYFSERLDESLKHKDDSRYRLRHTGYRAMIFNQLGENETAEVHWRNGDEQLHSTESAIERGQYLVFRGMSYSLTNDLGKARRTFELAKHELKLAGSPALYLAELDIAESLAGISNPSTRGSNLKQSFLAAESAYHLFLDRAKVHVYPLQAMYSEAAEFCDAILNGTHTKKSQDFRQSLALSVIENVSFMNDFAKELSHFRLIPDFIHKLSESDLTDVGLMNAMEDVLRIRPIIVENKFRLPGAMASLQNHYEINTILDFASTLYGLGQKSKELFQANSRLKEATRAKHLLHDVRFFVQELSKHANSNATSINLSKLSNQLNDLIESYLQSMSMGENPSRPSIVNFPKLLNQVVQMTEQVTGKSAELPSLRPLPFLWVSEVLLKRLLLNLIKNGMEAGTGKNPVSISYSVEERNGVEKLVVYISDNGPGLDPTIFENISNQSEIHVTSTKVNGVGLGLRSAVECARDIGAGLSIVPTTRTTGTTFKVTLSLPKRTVKTQDPEILVIDDSEAVRSAWTTFGADERISVGAVYGEDAVQALNHLSKSIAWVVLDYDLKLPNSTGADLAQALAGMGPKIALSSGFLESELPDEARMVPWNAILSKEPQYPTDVARNVIQLPSRDKTVLTPSLESASEIRHEIKNELTPLRISIKALLKNLPDDPNVKRISCSVKEIEKIVKQTTPNREAQ